MKQEWETTQSWVAYFDILGFKAIVEDAAQHDAKLQILKETLDETVEELKNDVEAQKEYVDFQFYVDTFIIHSKSEKINDYPSLVRISKKFIHRCIIKRLPARGAISYGELIFGHNRKILLGKAFLESYKYGEDQNWVGLILTPSASSRLIECNLNPARHGFINRDIPMRKFSIFDDEIYAYRFINGSTNFKCPLLHFLKEMLAKAPQEEEKVKYKNTIGFMERHYTVHTS